tara:strand:+ start:103 stop:609 length:507 start_codon:yes stop_codon:yes gene_type:complete
MEPDLFVPGDQQYQMVNQPLEPVGIAPLVEGQGMPLPDFKKVAINVGKNMAANYAARKLGLNAAKASGLMSILGVGANVFSPLAAVSALSGRSLGISDYLANKRAQKQYAKSENMLESRVLSNQLANQGTAKDDAMGGGSIPTKTSGPKSIGVANPYSGGIGGLQSGL